LIGMMLVVSSVPRSSYRPIVFILSCLHPVAVVLPLVRLLTTSIHLPRPPPPSSIPFPLELYPSPNNSTTSTFAYVLLRLQRPLVYLAKCPSSNFGHSVLCPFSALPTNPQSGTYRRYSAGSGSALIISTINFTLSLLFTVVYTGASLCRPLPLFNL
jgi:hypothetical protein